MIDHLSPSEPLHPLVTHEEAAAILGLNRTKVGLLIEVGEIPSFHDALGARCVHRADVIEWGRHRRTQQTPPGFDIRAFMSALADVIRQTLDATNQEGTRR